MVPDGEQSSRVASSALFPRLSKDEALASLLLLERMANDQSIRAKRDCNETNMNLASQNSAG